MTMTPSLTCLLSIWDQVGPEGHFCLYPSHSKGEGGLVQTLPAHCLVSKLSCSDKSRVMTQWRNGSFSASLGNVPKESTHGARVQEALYNY